MRLHAASDRTEFCPAAGAMVGAMVGLSGIPQRFIDGLAQGAELRRLAEKLAADAFPDAS